MAKGGKKLSDIDHVPAFWPDNDTVRNDMLDYAFEAEHFDRHLGRMFAELEKRGLLHNTLVVVTADHGMPFPRSKGNAYDLANHMPLAMMWPAGIAKPGRTVDDFVSFVDLAPTFIEVAKMSWAESGMAESPGRSLTEIFRPPHRGAAVRRWSVTSGHASSAGRKYSIRETRPGGRVSPALRAAELGTRNRLHHKWNGSNF